MNLILLLVFTGGVAALTKSTIVDEPICECIDFAPDKSKHSCYDMMMWGKCGMDWMQGRCECTCGKCKEIWIGDCMCNETPPPGSPLNCQLQKAAGKCDEYWMQGYCECSCGKCDAEKAYELSTLPSDENDLMEEIDFVFKVEMQFNNSSPSPSPSTISSPTVSPSSNPSPKVLSSPSFSPAQKSRKEAAVNKIRTGHVKFTIVHFNDFHARVQPAMENWWPCEEWRNAKGECYGGLARIKTVVDRERAKGLPVLVLDAGDDMIGTEWNHHYWDLEPAAKMLNDIGVDAMTLGNHEFDHGPDTLANYLKRLNYPALSCNMQPNGHYLGDLVQKYIIKEIQGKKIGIFGITTTYTNEAAAAKPGPVWFGDASAAALECVRELTKQKGVDIVIALTHHGFNADKYLARQIPDIDIVIGGHSHALLTSPNHKMPTLASGNKDSSWGNYPAWTDSWVQPGRKVPVVQVGWATRYVGSMTVEFDNNGNLVSLNGKPILLDKNIPEDRQLKRYGGSKKFWD